MPTSKTLLRQVRRALCAVFVLGGFAMVLQLALPLYVLHVLESVAVAGGSVETLALLTAFAAAATPSLSCACKRRATAFSSVPPCGSTIRWAAIWWKTARAPTARPPPCRRTPAPFPPCATPFAPARCSLCLMRRGCSFDGAGARLPPPSSRCAGHACGRLPPAVGRRSGRPPCTPRRAGARGRRTRRPVVAPTQHGRPTDTAMARPGSGNGSTAPTSRPPTRRHARQHGV